MHLAIRGLGYLPFHRLWHAPVISCDARDKPCEALLYSQTVNITIHAVVDSFMYPVGLLFVLRLRPVLTVFSNAWSVLYATS